MSLFGSLLGAVESGAIPGLGDGAQGLIAQGIAATTEGGVPGLLAKLEAGGLGPQVASWLGQGQNLPISADQLQAALGDGHLQQMASALGLPVDSILQGLAAHLPALADALPKAG